MTQERLAELRGLVERGELGCGPKTAALVRELLEHIDAPALWSSEWPIEPGWYWARQGGMPAPAQVGIGGTGDAAHLYYIVCGSYAYPGERYWLGLEWGPRIPVPR